MSSDFGISLIFKLLYCRSALMVIDCHMVTYLQMLATYRHPYLDPLVVLLA